MPSTPEFDPAWLQACRACSDCDLAVGRQQVVISRGSPAAALMLIGEAPGAQEDERGEPFVGRSGRLLDQLLIQAGFDLARDVFVSNVVKCRPPSNRKPTARELQSCRPWIDHQIAVVNPRVVVLVGATAVAAMLGLKGAMRDRRGVWIDQAERFWMPVFHPSYLLRNPSRDPGKPVDLTLQDLRQVRRRLCQCEPAFGAPIP